MAVPPSPDEFVFLTGEEPPDPPLRRWWVVPAVITGLLGAPVSLGLAEAIGLRAALTVVGTMFVIMGVISIAIRLVQARRSGASTPLGPLLLAFAVLAAVAVATVVLRPLLPTG